MEAPFSRLYVGNSRLSVSWDDLREISIPFGELEQVTLQRSEQFPLAPRDTAFFKDKTLSLTMNLDRENMESLA